ncbi:SHOCT domain-containing protein [Alicyclobacillus mengziensis]|uniref:SHOCT domain-containing protein n=1 Tax=Alicyclobacillus mengziensis TaxID=2931921 RepID=A0A9X7W1V5_9BACL|nr:SHOCT domain-containing protein [Alicyclobacillus mengziensis]
MWYGGYDSRPRSQDSSAGSAAQDTPLELLKQRLARGEITLDEYEKLAKVLSS